MRFTSSDAQYVTATPMLRFQLNTFDACYTLFFLFLCSLLSLYYLLSAVELRCYYKNISSDEGNIAHFQSAIKQDPDFVVWLWFV